MVSYKIFILTAFLAITLGNEFKQPTILIAILVRNKAHILPYFLSNLEKVNYSKERISLW